MKKFVCSVVAAMFLVAVGSTVFAAEATLQSTPTAKMVKHKAHHHHHQKASHKKKSEVKPESTPAPKK